MVNEQETFNLGFSGAMKHLENKDQDLSRSHLYCFILKQLKKNKNKEISELLNRCNKIKKQIRQSLYNFLENLDNNADEKDTLLKDLPREVKCKNGTTFITDYNYSQGQLSPRLEFKLLGFLIFPEIDTNHEYTVKEKKLSSTLTTKETIHPILFFMMGMIGFFDRLGIDPKKAWDKKLRMECPDSGKAINSPDRKIKINFLDDNDQIIPPKNLEKSNHHIPIITAFFATLLASIGYSLDLETQNQIIIYGIAAIALMTALILKITAPKNLINKEVTTLELISPKHICQANNKTFECKLTNKEWQVTLTE